MTIVAWPVATRGQVVHAFKPGVTQDAEAPFRTLRLHRWTSAGVRVLPRSGGRLKGQKYLFSSLNVDAAHLVRHGYKAAAKRMAHAAEALEEGPEFSLLQQLLTATAEETTDAVLGGELPEGASSELGELLRRLARRTEQVRSSENDLTKIMDLLTGQVIEVHDGYVVLRQVGGPTTAVPRWLAVAVHRDKPGAWLILIVDRLAGASALVNAVPGILLDGGRSAESFTPFGRDAHQALMVTDEDAVLLSRQPEPLNIVVPVEIEG